MLKCGAMRWRLMARWRRTLIYLLGCYRGIHHSGDASESRHRRRAQASDGRCTQATAQLQHPAAQRSPKLDQLPTGVRVTTTHRTQPLRLSVRCEACPSDRQLQTGNSWGAAVTKSAAACCASDSQHSRCNLPAIFDYTFCSTHRFYIRRCTAHRDIYQSNSAL